MSKIYMLRSNLYDYSFFYHINTWPAENSIQHCAMKQYWKPFSSDYEPVILTLSPSSIGRKDFYFDISGFCNPFFVVSERALDKIGDILEPRGQILPIITESKRTKFFGYYPTNPLSGCLDKINSEYSKGTNGIIVHKPALIAENITDEYLFSIEEDPIYVFVTQSFNRRIEDARLAGFDLKIIPTT